MLGQEVVVVGLMTRYSIVALALAFIAPSRGTEMSIVHIEIADPRSFVITLNAVDRANFRVSTITVLDDSMSPVWMIAADNVAIEPVDEPENDVQPALIRGSEVIDVVRSDSHHRPAVGRYIRTVKFGETPPGFIELVPRSDKCLAPLAIGNTYHVFVNGTESGSAIVRI